MAPSHLLMQESKNMKKLASSIELYLEVLELRALGLSQEEIDGYIEFFIDSWINNEHVLE